MPDSMAVSPGNVERDRRPRRPSASAQRSDGAMTPAPELRDAPERSLRLDADRVRADPAGFALLVREAQAAGQRALDTGRPAPTARVEARAPATHAEVHEALAPFCVFGR